MINEESEGQPEQIETISPARELAQLLRQGREAQNLSLERVAMSTKISLPFIKSLEEANYQNLPEIVFSRGFIRNLCKIYEIPSEQPLQLFHHAIELSNETSLAREETKTRKLLTKSKATLQPDSRSKKMFRLRTLKPVPFGILVLGLAIGMLSSYYFLSQSSLKITSISPIPAKQKELKVAKVKNSESIVAEKTLPAKQPTEKPVNDGLQEVEIVAKSKVKIKLSTDGGTWETKTLEPATHLFTYATHLNLQVYDPAAVEISHNGKSLGNLGASGTIKKLNFKLEQDQIAIKPSAPGNN